MIIFGATLFNKYGHVVIISKVTDNQIEIIQQNPGPKGKSREMFKLSEENNRWVIQNKPVLGSLTKETKLK